MCDDVNMCINAYETVQWCVIGMYTNMFEVIYL